MNLFKSFVKISGQKSTEEKPRGQTGEAGRQTLQPEGLVRSEWQTQRLGRRKSPRVLQVGAQSSHRTQGHQPGPGKQDF